MTRTITTAAELDALPVGSVVRNLSRGITAERLADGRGAIPGNPTACPWGSLWSAGSHIVVLHDPSAPVVPVVSDAAIEAAALVLAERWGAPGAQDAYRPDARAALSAALPFLGTAPSVEHIARTLAETTALSGADATREEVAEMAAQMLPPMHEPLRTKVAEEWADRWLDRFTITTKGADR